MCHLYSDDALPYYMKQVLVVDLSRMVGDMIGASTGNQIAMQVTLNYSAPAGTFIFDG